MNTGHLQIERAITTPTATYLPDVVDNTVDAALGLITPPFPPGTRVEVGVFQRDNLPGRPVPPSFPRLDSAHTYAYAAPWGWAKVKVMDIIHDRPDGLRPEGIEHLPAT